MVLLGLSIMTSGCTKTPTTNPDQPPKVGNKDTSHPQPTVKSYKDPGCKDEDDEMCRVNNTGPMNVGWIDSGVTVAKMLEMLGEPDKKEARLMEEATGDIYETWTWTKKGVRAQILAQSMTGKLKGVGNFTVSQPFAGKTERGVGIGSTSKEVLDVYPGLLDPMSTLNKQIIVGSVYGGIFFDIVNGRVTSIFVGAGAE